MCVVGDGLKLTQIRLGTARLTGQTVGAALVALIFGVSPKHGPMIALTVAAGVAGLASVVSFMRLRAQDSARERVSV